MSERARDRNYLFLFVKEKWNGRFKNHFTFAEENMVIKQKFNEDNYEKQEPSQICYWILH